MQLSIKWECLACNLAQSAGTCDHCTCLNWLASAAHWHVQRTRLAFADRGNMLAELLSRRLEHPGLVQPDHDDYHCLSTSQVFFSAEVSALLELLRLYS